MNATDDAAAGDPLAARELALRVLVRVAREPVHADAVLAEALAPAALPSRDRALATRLVYGTLAWQGFLDWHLAPAVSRSLAALDPAVLAVLRLGAYQILLLDRVPDHAAVATSVALVKGHVAAASGLVNAVLRRTVRERGRVPLPDREREPAAHLAIALSHPQWLVDRWLARFGPAATRALLAADNEAAPTVLRARPGQRDELIARLRAADVRAGPGRFGPHAVRVDAVDPHALPGFAAGDFSVQGEASQLVAILLDARPGLRVLDACAAPGGKTAAVAELMEDRGTVVAVDHRRRGVRAIARNAARLRLRSIAPLALDARTAAGTLAPRSFARILVDAPCTGFGTLRAHPEIRWRRGVADVARLAAEQRAILEAVTPLAAPGGVIVYATCTLTEEENEGVVGAWLAAHPELVRERADQHLPEPARELVDPAGALVTLPHRDDLDGFFAVRVRRT
jgi:16S rRNA (cytosine967-C5)-methyltransferase